MTDFKPGDRVRVRSGGPLMTVVRVSDDYQMPGGEPGVACTWFDEDSTPKHHVFSPSALRKEE